MGKRGRPQISDEVIHSRVSQGLKEHRVRFWGGSQFRTSTGFTLHSIYQLVHERNFFGHGSWKKYIENHHGAKVEAVRTSSQKVSNEKLHEKINKLIQETGITLAKQWGGMYERTPLGRKMHTLFIIAHSRKIGGKSFCGYGTWDNYLEEVHGVVPLDQRLWSDRRFHDTVALMIRRHPPEKISWGNRREPLVHGKSLKILYELAYRSNKSREKPQVAHFFGHGIWSKYVKWVRENYNPAVKR